MKHIGKDKGTLEALSLFFAYHKLKKSYCDLIIFLASKNQPEFLKSVGALEKKSFGFDALTKTLLDDYLLLVSHFGNLLVLYILHENRYLITEHEQPSPLI